MARLFNGSSDYVSIADDAAFDIRAMTLSAWVYVNTLPSTNQWDGIISKGAQGETATDNHNFLLTLDSNLFGSGLAFTFLFEESGGANRQARYGVAVGIAGAWHHLAGVYDTAAQKMILYLDGVNVAETASITATPNTNNHPVLIGRNQSGSNYFYFDGRIAEAAIWNVALGPNEIAALAKGYSPARLQRAGLVGYWPLYGVGSPEPDYSGNARNGTLTGTTAADGPPIQTPFYGTASLPSLVSEGETFTGTGDAAFGFSTEATGKQSFIASGDAGFGFSASGTAAQAFTGSGGAGFGFSAEATGKLAFAGSGTAAFGLSVSGAGKQTFTGTASMSFGFSMSGSYFPTDAARTVTIPYESRMARISAENRTVKIPAEDRTVLV